MSDKALSSILAGIVAGTTILYGVVDGNTRRVPVSDILGLVSSYSGFTQAGTGAETRTWQNKARDQYSVLDFVPESELSAIRGFTNTTDLTTYVNNAIDAVQDAGGGKLHMPRGRYTIASEIGQTGLQNVVVKGEGGRDLTYAGTSGTVIRFTGTGAGNIVNMQNHRGVWWEDLQVVSTSGSFTGTVFNCATTFSTGCGSGFRNVQFYQTGTHSAGQVWYVKNNVDVTFDGCYASHAAFGWVGLFDADATSPTNETNIIRLKNCTAIALRTAAIVNPIVGWQLDDCNFELSDTNAPCGLLATGAHTVTNLGLYKCVFADSTIAGTWINLPVDIFNLTMIGGAILTASAPSGTGMILGNTVCSGLVVHGVLFSGLSIGITLSASGTVASIIGNEFLNTTTPLSGAANLDATSIVIANNGLAPRAIAVTAGGTGFTSYTVGDLLYANGTTTLAKLAGVATGNALISGGVGASPSWGKIGITTHVDGLGSNVATFLATPSSANLRAALTDETGTGAAVFADTPTLVAPILGTPTSGTLTNCTGLPISTGVSGLGAGIATFLATPSSANLRAALTDETGTGAAVFATNPTFDNGFVGQSTGGVFSFTGPSGGSVALVRYNALNAGEAIGFGFLDGGTTIWVLAKQTDNSWRLNDFANSVDAITANRGAASAGSVVVGYTTASTSPSTGSLRTGGGLGVAGAMYGGGAILSNSATAGIGYATGAGGTVTQSTNKSTGVTLNKVTGQITMNNATLNAGAEVGFTVTNSAVAATDTIVLNIASGATADSYLLGVDAVAAGSFRITVTNVSASNLGEAIVINFAVIKGVTS